MVESPITQTDETELAIRKIQWFTIIWMAIEVAVAFMAAIRAHSVALTAFGGDSAVELLSAVVVLWRFRHHASEHAEQRAARIAGGLLFVLAVCVVSASAMSLLGYSEPKPSYLGMAVLMAALLIMPWLAWEKRRLSAATGSAALRADAAESDQLLEGQFVPLELADRESWAINRKRRHDHVHTRAVGQTGVANW